MTGKRHLRPVNQDPDKAEEIIANLPERKNPKPELDKAFENLKRVIREGD